MELSCQSRRMLVGGAARRLRGRGWPVRDDVSALTGHVHRLVPSLRRLDLLRLLLALHLHRRRHRLPDRQGRLLRSARRSKLQNPIRAQEGQASQTNRFIYCPRQTHYSDCRRACSHLHCTEVKSASSTVAKRIQAC